MKISKKYALLSALALSMGVSAAQANKLDISNFEHTYHQIGHSDGWDKEGNWIGVNLYEVIIKSDDKIAIGHFGVQGTPTVIQFNESIVWKHNTNGFLSETKALNDFSSLKQTERNEELINEARRLSY